MKLTILNLDRTITEEELKDLFEKYGSVESCDLVLDRYTKESKGFGFVEMPNTEDAEFAIKNLNNKKIANNKIRVKQV